MNTILELQNLSKHYPTESGQLTVLHEISFTVERGTSMAIVGASGSGKTTLLGLCAGLDRASEGDVILAGNPLVNTSEDERALLRNRHVGFIFQNFQLMPTLTALENVMVPMELKGDKNPEKKAMELLARVGLEKRFHHYPVQLSGGEQQRVALARAFSNTPEILFADEPTGNLDDETSQKVENLLFDLNREQGTTLVLVTHDTELAAKTQRVITLKGGKIIQDTLHNQ